MRRPGGVTVGTTTSARRARSPQRWGSGGAAVPRSWAWPAARSSGPPCCAPGAGAIRRPTSSSSGWEPTGRTREQEAAGHIPDMQLHDHCVIANLALRQAGREDATGNRWGCIDARAVMLMQLEAGALWRVQLAHEMEGLGFAIDRVGDAWELRGVTRTQIERNSGRDREVRERIAQWTREHGRPPREDERRTIVVTGR